MLIDCLGVVLLGQSHEGCEKLGSISGKFCQPGAQLVPDEAEGGQAFFFGAFNGRGVFEAFMQLLCFSEIDRAGFTGVVADGDYGIEIMAREFIDRF